MGARLEHYLSQRFTLETLVYVAQNAWLLLCEDGFTQGGIGRATGSRVRGSAQSKLEYATRTSQNRSAFLVEH